MMDPTAVVVVLKAVLESSLPLDIQAPVFVSNPCHTIKNLNALVPWAPITLRLKP